jgi:hypothetical protein
VSLKRKIYRIVKKVPKEMFNVGQEINPLKAELKIICHLLKLLVRHHILQVTRLRVNSETLNFR